MNEFAKIQVQRRVSEIRNAHFTLRTEPVSKSTTKNTMYLGIYVIFFIPLVGSNWNMAGCIILLKNPESVWKMSCNNWPMVIIYYW
jgi:hypothetical protein